jgi:hypothetical protein
MKEFNITGPCFEARHYMVDISRKIAAIKALIDKGRYFTINRARQYGKTTTINELRLRLADEYLCLWISFEGLGDTPFESDPAFCMTFMSMIQNALRFTALKEDSDYIERWVNPEASSFKQLDVHISAMCEGRKILLMIDEVDRASDNRMFLHFIGILRDKYIRRDTGASTFHSVILVGVYDIRNIKLKLINEGVYKPAAAEGKLLNSPWNIAAPFTVDMSFNPVEIATMLRQYEADYQTGMDILEIAREIYEYTSGYPYLVSSICRYIDEMLNKDWSSKGVQEAVKLVLSEGSTLFDDVIKNLESNQDLYQYIYELLIMGVAKKYSVNNLVLAWGIMFGFLKKNNEDKIVVANRIFELQIADYFVEKDALKHHNKSVSGVLRQDVVENGHFNMELCLRKFAEHYRQLFTEADIPFLERHGRLIFLSYLQPLINGAGFYHIESQLTDLRRMDIVVDYCSQQFIIELKLWRGKAAHQEVYTQLAAYLRDKGAQEGYLLSFDFRREAKKRRPLAKWVEKNDVRIFDVMP